MTTTTASATFKERAQPLDHRFAIHQFTRLLASHRQSVQAPDKGRRIKPRTKVMLNGDSSASKILSHTMAGSKSRSS